MLFGMSTACFFPHTNTEKTVELMAEMNIHHAEVFLCCLSEYKKSFVSDLKNRMSDLGIKAYSIHPLSLQFEPQLFSSYQRAKRDGLDVFKQVLEAGEELGAGVYVFHGPSNVKKARRFSVNYEYTAQCVNPLAEMAKDYGIKLAWENVHWCWYAEPNFPAKLIPLLTSDNLCFTLDIKQAAQAGHNPCDYIAAAKNRLVNVHICDFEHSKEHGIIPALPFEGDMDFSMLRDSLQKANYRSGMMLEVYSHNYKNQEQLNRCYHQIKSFFSQNTDQTE